MAILSKNIFLVIPLILLTACASIPEDYGRQDVNLMLDKRGLSVDIDKKSKNHLENLISSSMGLDEAIQIALINNADLKKTYADLDLAAADIYEASRVRNPVFSFSSLDSNESGEKNKLTYGLVVSFTDLITLSSRKRIAEGEFEIMKQNVGAEVINIVAGTQKAYYEYVAARQIAKMRDQIAKAGELSYQLAQRYFDAGNLSERDIAYQQATASEAALQSLDAKAIVDQKRSGLANYLGLSVADDWDVPAQLIVPLAEEDTIEVLLNLALDSRLELAAARKQADLIADRLGVVDWTRWLGELNVGIEHERETDGADLTGPTLEWEVPIFNQNRDRQIRTNAELKKAIAGVEHLYIEIENSVRLAHAALLNTKSRIEEAQNSLIPARIEVVERAREEEAFMLIGIFELLETKQEEYDAYQTYLEIVRDYWLSRTELARVVGNTLPSSQYITSEIIDVDDFITSGTNEMDHSRHSHH